MADVGIFFGTSTGNTETCAEKIQAAFGSDVAAEPVDVDTLDAGTLADALGRHDALVVGTPTWNTGADTERSGTGWDELYYGPLQDAASVLGSKKVAVFGLGDQVSYAENYADATGELYDVFEKLGCTMLGSWSTDGYEHEASKAIRGGDKFCGLVLDEVNQEEETDGRIERWVAQLKEEGILEGAGASSGGAVPASATTTEAPATTTAAAATTSVVINGDVSAVVDDSSMAAELARLQRENEELRNLLTSAGTSTGGGPVATTTSSPATVVAEATPPPSSSSSDGFTPHYNPVTGKTMWTSSNGRKSYVT